MTKVHDIIVIRVGSKLEQKNPLSDSFPVAFIQHGNKEDGFEYEGFCPFCGLSIGMCAPQGVMENRDKALAVMMATHYQKGCAHWGAHKFLVEKATAPLNTEKKIVIH